MEIKIDESSLESRIYRRILEFIKKEGIESFTKFVIDLSQIDHSYSTGEELLDRRRQLIKLINSDQIIVEFLKQFKNGFLRVPIDSLDFASFIKDTASDIEKIDTLIENARKLETLKIGSVYYGRYLKIEELITEFFMQKDGNITTIRKQYTDGDINYSHAPGWMMPRIETEYCKFSAWVTGDPTWIIESDNLENGYQSRSVYIRNFAFNNVMLPDHEKLSTYKKPKSLQHYINNN